MVNVYVTRFFTVNSTTGLMLMTLVVHSAYAKVIITVENPSDTSLLIYLSNGMKLILGPNSKISLTYLFTPSNYLAYPVCSGGFRIASSNASVLIPFIE